MRRSRVALTERERHILAAARLTVARMRDVVPPNRAGHCESCGRCVRLDRGRCARCGSESVVALGELVA